MTKQERIRRLIQSGEDTVSDESIREVLHFFEHGEYEMAFEGLTIEVIKLQRKPQDFDPDEWATVLKELKLDEESVFEPDIWQNFQIWGKMIANTS